MAKSALARELETRDRFLAQVSLGLNARVRRLRACSCSGLVELRSFARELAIIVGDEQALVPRRKRLDVGRRVRDLVRHWEKRFARRARILVEVTGDTRGTLDPDELESMVAELLSNALKYGAGKPVQIQVEGLPQSIRITIRDRGAGVERGAARGRLFARGASAPKKHGFGVGVWLVRRLAAAHGGRFRLSSAKGGTRAVIELPKVQVRARA